MKPKYEANSSNGPVKFAIADCNGNIVVFFDARISWFALPKEEAASFANAILERTKVMP